MTTRYDIERALEASDLPAIGRDIVFALCRCMQQGSTMILQHHSPSLTVLGRRTGWSRKTVMRYLTDLEKAGWIERRRPPADLARTVYMTTLYVVRIPGTLGTQGASLGPEGASLGPEGAADQICSSPETDREIDLVITELAKHTGRTISREHAAKVRDQIVNRPGVRNRMTYLTGTLRRTPARFLPSQEDEPYCERCGAAGHPKSDCPF